MKLILTTLTLSLVLVKAAKIIEIENGKIEGEELESFYAFRGIPYATAERFARSESYEEKWEGVREFKNFGSQCAQYNHMTYQFNGEEDCLFLNVFVPKLILEAESLVPVLFFIHGGAFTFGAADYYNPENIMENGKMIFVSINYRLGILGFLSTEDDVLPGNLGLKDQVEALKWVQRNIKAFNGDASKVTLVGFSAGGASVQLHYQSNLSKGLFNNGISQSGIARVLETPTKAAREKSHKLATFAECPFDDHQEMLNCLKEKPVQDLVLLTKKFQPFLYNPFTPFGVVVEPESDHAFLTEHPMKSLKSGNYNRRPWLLSLTKDEGTYPSAEFYRDERFLKAINERWEELAPFILQFDDLSQNETLKKEVSRRIREVYMGDKEISRKNIQFLTDILSDGLFKSYAKISFEAQSKFSPSYMYYFNFKALFGIGEMFAGTNLGIAHGEDACLIYGVARALPYSDEEKSMIKSLVDLYYNFATTGVPSFNGLDIKKSSPENLKYLKIYSNEKFANIKFERNFGEAKFWQYFEAKLKGC